MIFLQDNQHKWFATMKEVALLESAIASLKWPDLMIAFFLVGYAMVQRTVRMVRMKKAAVSLTSRPFKNHFYVLASVVAIIL